MTPHKIPKNTEKMAQAQSQSYYAVRGGLNPGIYNNWVDAVNAGWHQRQPFGNAVKCENMEQAEHFLSLQRGSTPIRARATTTTAPPCHGMPHANHHAAIP